MDPEVENEITEEDNSSAPPQQGGGPAGETSIATEHSGASIDTPAAKQGPTLDLNQLQDYSSEDLESLARELDLRLYAARSRHQHILDVVRAGLSRGSAVTIEGFLEQGEAASFL